MQQIDNTSPYWFVVSSYCAKHLAQDEYWQAGVLRIDDNVTIIRIFVDGPEYKVIDLEVTLKKERKVVNDNCIVHYSKK